MLVEQVVGQVVVQFVFRIGLRVHEWSPRRVVPCEIHEAVDRPRPEGFTQFVEIGHGRALPRRTDVNHGWRMGCDQAPRFGERLETANDLFHAEHQCGPAHV